MADRKCAGGVFDRWTDRQVAQLEGGETADFTLMASLLTPTPPDGHLSHQSEGLLLRELDLSELDDIA